MSFASGQLISSQDALTCCGGIPERCFYALNASSCPSGYDPQYCCMPDGSVTSALFLPDNSGERTDYPFCMVPGSLRTSNLNQCFATPTMNCCYEGQCYPSKYYLGSTCYAGGPTMGGPNQELGQVVTSCTQCPSHVTCCDRRINACYEQPSCNPGDKQVTHCGQCPYPTALPMNFLSSNGNWELQ